LICRQLEQIYLLTAGAVAAVTAAAGTEILTDDLQIVVFLNHPTYNIFKGTWQRGEFSGVFADISTA
jgi:hypothetical protein